MLVGQMDEGKKWRLVPESFEAAMHSLGKERGCYYFLERFAMKYGCNIVHEPQYVIASDLNIAVRTTKRYFKLLMECGFIIRLGNERYQLSEFFAYRPQRGLTTRLATKMYLNHIASREADHVRKEKERSAKRRN